MKFLKSSSLAILALIVIGLLACQVNFSSSESYRGEGKVLIEKRSLAKIKGIELVGSTDVSIRYGNTQSVNVKGHGNIVERLKIEVSGGIAQISLKEGSYSDYELEVELILPLLEEIVVTGSGDVKVDGFKNIDELEAKIVGSGEIEMNSCEMNDLEVEVIGSGDFNAVHSKTQVADIQVTGSGDAYVNVMTFLDAAVSGSGDIRYKGNPKTEIKVHGSGEVSRY